MKIVLAIVFAFALSGCADMRVYKRSFSGPDTVIRENLKSYRIGREQAVTVGEPIIRWQEQTLNIEHGQRKYISRSDFVLKGDYKFGKGVQFFGSYTFNPNIRISSGSEFYCVGETDYEGSKYCVAGNPKKNKYFLMIDETGKLNKNILVGPNLNQKFLLQSRLDAEESEVVFDQGVNDTVSRVPGVTKEIVFGGKNNVSFNFTYREYTGEGIARPAFTQEIVYPADVEIIRFRDFKIKINDFTENRISYTVLEDGLPPSK